MASLSESNSINEILVDEKVMGMKMTEHVRKIAQFFMKKFPLDIDSIYYPKPDLNKEYFTFRSAAIVGGTFTSVSDIIEKILLINQFVRQFE